MRRERKRVEESGSAREREGRTKEVDAKDAKDAKDASIATASLHTYPPSSASLTRQLECEAEQSALAQLEQCLVRLVDRAERLIERPRFTAATCRTDGGTRAGRGSQR
eukprot:3655765-Pleurochrysis_carterae.AAC.1